MRDPAALETALLHELVQHVLMKAAGRMAADLQPVRIVLHVFGEIVDGLELAVGKHRKRRRLRLHGPKQAEILEFEGNEPWAMPKVSVPVRTRML